MSKRILFLVVAFYSCNKDFKRCDFKTTDTQLQVYNDVLTELIEHGFYDRYLGEEADRLAEKYDYNSPDTIKYKREIIALQNKIFNDTSAFHTLCLRNSLIHGPWSRADMLERKDTTQQWTEIRNFLLRFSPQWRLFADTLSSPQTKYLSGDFHLCTSKLVPYDNFKECDIGVVGFSKILLNESNSKGLLYYEFSCWGNCGRGELIVIEKSHGRWRITGSSLLWIS
jgi:hypothetical protein